MSQVRRLKILTLEKRLFFATFCIGNILTPIFLETDIKIQRRKKIKNEENKEPQEEQGLKKIKETEVVLRKKKF